MDSEVTTCSETVDVNLLQFGTNQQKEISKGEMKDAQLADNIISPIYDFVQRETRPSKAEKARLRVKTRILLRQFRKLVLKNGILVRQLDKRTQIVLPYQYHGLVFTELHTNMGHLGPEEVEELARQRFYWPYMTRDITDYIQNRCPCIASKRKARPEKAPLVPIQASAPFERVCIDFLHLDLAQGGWNYVLMVTDHFTRYTQTYAIDEELTPEEILTQGTICKGMNWN